jgi:hypothetical protein
MTCRQKKEPASRRVFLHNSLAPAVSKWPTCAASPTVPLQIGVRGDDQVSRQHRGQTTRLDLARTPVAVKLHRPADSRLQPCGTPGIGH